MYSPPAPARYTDYREISIYTIIHIYTMRVILCTTVRQPYGVALNFTILKSIMFYKM